MTKDDEIRTEVLTNLDQLLVAGALPELPGRDDSKRTGDVAVTEPVDAMTVAHEAIVDLVREGIILIPPVFLGAVGNVQDSITFHNKNLNWRHPASHRT